MIKTIYFILPVILILTVLSGCGSSEKPLVAGESYLDGSWYYDDGTLQVGYNLFNNGTGFLFIGETVTPIRYGIYGNEFYIENQGEISKQSYETEGDCIRIGQLLFLPVSDNPELASSIEQQKNEQNTDPQISNSTKYIIAAVAVALSAILVMFLVRWYRKRKNNAGI